MAVGGAAAGPLKAVRGMGTAELQHDAHAAYLQARHARQRVAGFQQSSATNRAAEK